MPSSRARVSLMTTTAAAPSLRGQLLPAVTSPSGRNAGLSSSSFSTVVPARGPSSTRTSVPSARVSGLISISKNPFSCDATALCWDRAANSSISWRLTFSSSRTFSAVWPMAMYTSGSPDAGAQRSEPPRAREALRSSAPANRALWVSGMPSDMPCAKRLTASTPAAMNTSPSPALMACAAIRIVWSDDEQYRLTVVPGTEARPANSATTRAML